MVYLLKMVDLSMAMLNNQMVVSDINHSDIRRIIAMYSELLTINHCNYNITNGYY